MTLAKFFRSVIVVGDRVVEAKLMSTRVVIREVIGERLRRIAEAFDAAREGLIPKVTGRAASSLFSEIKYDRLSVGGPRIYMRAGYHSDVAPYVDFLDFGTGVHHVPDPHPPWVQEVKHGPRRTFHHANVFFGLGERTTTFGLREVIEPGGTQRVIHYGAKPLLFTERALDIVRPIYTVEMRTAGAEIARRIG